MPSPFQLSRMVSAILLAAGSSGRMENKNKLLLPYEGKTMLTFTIGNILAAGIGELIVVTGYEETLVRNTIGDLPVRTIHNPDHKQGMTSSIQTGVRAAKAGGYMICHADMVWITPEEYSLLKSAFEEKIQLDERCICQPEYKGAKGNPVIFSAFYRDAILQHPEKEGCKGILRSYPENVYPVAMPSGHILKDIDYPDDYRALSQPPRTPDR